ncbi:MAG: hypothetical protein K2N94_01465, partial [Lachnospiraceae bacterium]|nr:hypothetical protein [Lachnospiraceae bacterium]
MTNYYELLEVSNNTSTEVIRAAYDEELAAKMQFSGGGGRRDAWNTKYGGNSNAKSTGNSSYSGRHTSGVCDTDDLTAYVESLIIRCKNEAEYLDLHDLISKINAPELEKLLMLSILDEFT